MDRILRRAFLNAIGTFAYIVLVVSIIFSFQRFSSEPDTIIIPIAMLLLFVCSAAITGFLVFGKPVMLYIDGKKKEAISLLSHTVGILATITAAVFILLVVYLRLS